MDVAKEWAKTLPDSPVTRLRVDYMFYPYSSNTSGYGLNRKGQEKL